VPPPTTFLAIRLTPSPWDGVLRFMSNEDMNPRRPLEKGERKRIGIFEPFKFGKLPGFYLWLFGSIVLTAVVAVGGAWLLMRMGVQ
jgi:hypothetical protein